MIRNILIILALFCVGCQTDDSPPEYAGYVDIAAAASSTSPSINHLITLTANPSIRGYVYIHDAGWYLEDGPVAVGFSQAYLDQTNAWFTEPGEYTVAYRIVWRDGYGTITTTVSRVVITVTPSSIG